MTTDIRALTVQQPWAHAIAHLGKRTENRTTPLRRGVGTLFIHAGKTTDKAGSAAFTRRDLRLPDGMAFGAVIAVTSVIGCCGAGVGVREECSCDSWAADGQWHWRLGEVTPLREPVPCRGSLGLWIPYPEAIDAVLAQLPVAVSS